MCELILMKDTGYLTALIELKGVQFDQKLLGKGRSEQENIKGLGSLRLQTLSYSLSPSPSLSSPSLTPSSLPLSLSLLLSLSLPLPILTPTAISTSTSTHINPCPYTNPYPYISNYIFPVMGLNKICFHKLLQTHHLYSFPKNQDG